MKDWMRDTAGMTYYQLNRFSTELEKTIRHCIGLALEQDPEAAAAWTAIHGKSTD
jgi:hypothetical protein